jgi:hypothetical protein
MKVIGLLHEIIYDGPISFFKPFLFSFKLRGRCRFSQCSFSERQITFLFLFGFLLSASVVSNSVIHSRGTSIQIKLFVNSTLSSYRDSNASSSVIRLLCPFLLSWRRRGPLEGEKHFFNYKNSITPSKENTKLRNCSFPDMTVSHQR